MKIQWIKMLALLVLCLVPLTITACGGGAAAQPAEAVEAPVVDPAEPVVTHITAPGSYIESVGTYLVECDESTGVGAPAHRCTATVSTNTICLNNVNGDQIEVKPTISVSHDGFVTETRLFAEIGAGSWVVSANPVQYVDSHSDAGEQTCNPEIVFTVVMPSGGTVTKFP